MPCSAISMETLYHQEMGKVHARTYSQHLREIGLSGVWFAILEGVTIASERTRQEVEQALQRIVPKDKLPFVYTFEVKDPAQRRGARRSSTA
jgi:tryptophan synthase alpha subunit